MVTNPWEARARTVKATAIFNRILAGLTADDLRSPHLLEWIEHASDELRNDIAQAAGVHSPSDATWAEVTALVTFAVEHIQNSEVVA